jgi:DNA-binding CsgD family transcriptional regulator
LSTSAIHFLELQGNVRDWLGVRNLTFRQTCGVGPTREELYEPGNNDAVRVEKKAVDFVSVGLTDDEIATRLEVSKDTVLNCIALLLAKLRAKHRIEIVLYAYSNRANFLGTNNEATASLAVEDVLLVGRPAGSVDTRSNNQLAKAEYAKSQ